MKTRSLLTGIALGAIAASGIAVSAQARGGVDLYIDTGDYWNSHNRDYCYYHDCGDRWYARHHRHRWHDRNWWMTGDQRGGNWHGRDHRDGDWRDHDGDNNNNNNNNNDDNDGQHHHHHD